MTDEPPVRAALPAALDPPAPLDPRTVRALAALLSMDAADAAAVRARSPARRRTHAQYGPQLDLGDGSAGRSVDVDPAPSSEPS